MNRYIEFVERKIKNKKDLLERLKNLKTISNKYDLQVNELLTKNTKEDIENLQQIKCVLEAWEELNKTFEIGVEKQIEEIYIKGKNYYGNERTIWGYSKEGALKVKKALEVEDE